MTAGFHTYKFFDLNTVKSLVSCALLAISFNAASQTSLKAKINQVLTREHTCSASLSLRSQAITKEEQSAACEQLGTLEQQFHTLLAGKGKALARVKHDHNQSLRANIYKDQANFAQYAGQHFNMPVDNGGIYLEGLPEQAHNHAEFVAYQKEQGKVHNLGHEYIHYLDGRFNLYGDFCANLHDSHAPPENCPKPAPAAPYLVWWGEGLAEYIARGNQHPQAVLSGAQQAYRLSQLFDTAYEKNNGTVRIYTWSYLAVRFMLERHREQIQQMLTFTRTGDYPRYQSLVRSWGQTMDEEFDDWLDTLARTAVSNP